MKIGGRVKGTVQLVKDYGLIVAIDGHELVTGFIFNEQKKSSKWSMYSSMRLLSDCRKADE